MDWGSVTSIVGLDTNNKKERELVKREGYLALYNYHWQKTPFQQIILDAMERVNRKDLL